MYLLFTSYVTHLLNQRKASIGSCDDGWMLTLNVVFKLKGIAYPKVLLQLKLIQGNTLLYLTKVTFASHDDGWCVHFKCDL